MVSSFPFCMNWEQIQKSWVSRLIHMAFVGQTKWWKENTLQCHGIWVICRSLRKTKQQWTNSLSWQSRSMKVLMSHGSTEALKRSGQWSFSNDFRFLWERRAQIAHERVCQKNVKTLQACTMLSLKMMMKNWCLTMKGHCESKRSIDMFVETHHETHLTKENGVWVFCLEIPTIVGIVTVLSSISQKIMLNSKEWLICSKLLEFFLRPVLWKQMENDFFLLVFTALQVGHQLMWDCFQRLPRKVPAREPDKSKIDFFCEWLC